MCDCTVVAPFVGAWIEIHITPFVSIDSKSLRSSERGLKYFDMCGIRWIDSSLRSSERGLKFGLSGHEKITARRSVRRSVD